MTSANGKTRIGVIGAGIAGLSMSWLLDPARYEVTLFEKENRLGGHAHTVTVNDHGRDIYIDAGAQFFYDTYHPIFKRLLGILEVPIKDWSVDFTLRNELIDHTWLVTSKVKRDLASLLDQIRHIGEGGHWLQAILKLVKDVGLDISTMFYLWQFINQSLAEVLGDNWGIIAKDYVAELKFPDEFKKDFLWPFLTTIWTVGKNVQEASALAVVSYVGLGHPGGLNPFDRNTFAVWGVYQGTQAYVKKMAAEMEAVGKKIIYPAPVEHVERQGEEWVVTAAGQTYTFDHLVLAAPAINAVKFLPQNDSRFDRLREILGTYDYFDTYVDIHRDESFMPENKVDWTVLYQYWNGSEDQFTTTWQGRRQDYNVYKTWVTYSTRKPKDPITQIHFQHPDHRPAYFLNQYHLAALQGKENLWLSGSYTNGVDSHEDAITASMKIAMQLDNVAGGGRLSPNLLKLVDWEQQFEPPLEEGE